jgi:probable phosphoglycerate mutase
MKLYLVRHGQTDWNIGKQAQGVADIELNATGIAQAEALKDRIAAEGLQFDYVYASPLRRAKKTAQIIIYNDLLIERSYGDLEGKIVDWDNLGVDDLDIRQNTDIYGLEPIQAVLARSKSFLDDLLSRHASEPDARILVVAHGTLLKTLHYNIIGYTPDTNLRGFHLDNCELVEYSI